MNSKLWIRRALSTCSIVAIFAAYSMVTLAANAKASSELMISGGEGASVLVDGQTAQTGRTVFSGSTLTTSETASATLSCGAAGMIQLAPNSTATVNFDSGNITADLSAGSLTVVSSAHPVMVNTPSGAVSVDPGSVATASQTTQTKKKGGAAWIAFGVIFAVAAVALIASAVHDSDYQFGGNGTVVGGGGGQTSQTK